MREPFLIFGVSIFIYGVSIHHKEKNNKSLLLIASGAALVFLMRLHLFLIIGLWLYFYFFARKGRIKYLILLSFLPVIPVYLFFDYYSYSLTPEWLTYLRNDWDTKYGESGNFYGVFFWSTWLDVIADVPSLIIQFIFSPLPILHSQPTGKYIGFLVDLFYVILLLAFALLGINNTKNSIIWFFILFSGVVASSFWEFYIGGAVRHRMPFVLMTIFPAAIYLNQYFFKDANK